MLGHFLQINKSTAVFTSTPYWTLRLAVFWYDLAAFTGDQAVMRRDGLLRQIGILDAEDQVSVPKDRWGLSEIASKPTLRSVRLRRVKS